VYSGGSNDDAAFSCAIDLAESNHAKLTIVSAFDNISKLQSNMPTATNFIDEIIRQRKQDIKSLISRHKINDLLNIEVKIFTGIAFIDVISEVIEYSRDLLVKAIEPNEGLIETLFGSTDTKLLRKCPCPVWLIKARVNIVDKKILVGINFESDNPENEQINSDLLRLAGSLALTTDSELHVVHAWRLLHEDLFRSHRTLNSESEVDQMVKDEEQNRRVWLENTVNKNLSSIDKETSVKLNPKLHLIEGSAAKVIPELAESLEIEHMVLSTVGRSGIVGYLVGNTAETILNQINCSVLAIKPKGFVSPVVNKKT
jgi:nucleotide-binding universal stress UspA family protein